MNKKKSSKTDSNEMDIIRKSFQIIKEGIRISTCFIFNEAVNIIKKHLKPVLKEDYLD